MQSFVSRFSFFAFYRTLGHAKQSVFVIVWQYRLQN